MDAAVPHDSSAMQPDLIVTPIWGKRERNLNPVDFDTSATTTGPKNFIYLSSLFVTLRNGRFDDLNPDQ